MNLYSHIPVALVYSVFLLTSSNAVVVPRLRDPKQTNSPLIIIPGDAGNQVYTREKDKPEEEPSLLWLRLLNIFRMSKVTEELSLSYDPKTHTTHDNEKYEVIFPGWGDTSTIEYLDTTEHVFGEYLHGLVTKLRKDPYYVPRRTICGAPYDFRRAPNENHVFVSQMTKLVEETYEMNDNRPVVLLGHSLGALYTLYFLQQKTDEWKRTYVKAYMPVGAPFGGSVRALLAVTSGDNFGVFLRNPLVFRGLERSMPSIGLLLPNPRLWSPNEPLIFTPETNYSAHQYDKLFHDIAYPEGYQMYLDSTGEFDTFRNPTGVQVICVHGSQVSTPVSLTYPRKGYQMYLDSTGEFDTFRNPTGVQVICVHGSQVSTPVSLTYPRKGWFHKGFPDETPTITDGDGDGTVPIRSLEVCRQWVNTEHVVLPGAAHIPITTDPRFLTVLRRVLGSHISLVERETGHQIEDDVREI
ncbi:hypothetical protein P879_07551 [Paragonimus westermani]|uniref:Lysophospholipase III n=1 Tax=Paragonimus westermani TaxID=34504 RepID=A0A8T0DMD9_9TREM|nr:hypothetical protein P879_07551 [Paragonimus westermani]